MTAQVEDLGVTAGRDHRSVDAHRAGKPEATVRSAAERIDLVGPLVEGLMALGVEEHIVTPCGDGLVWSFQPGEPGRLRLAWTISVAAETEDTSVLSIALRATARGAPGARSLRPRRPAAAPASTGAGSP